MPGTLRLRHLWQCESRVAEIGTLKVLPRYSIRTISGDKSLQLSDDWIKPTYHLVNIAMENPLIINRAFKGKLIYEWAIFHGYSK